MLIEVNRASRCSICPFCEDPFSKNKKVRCTLYDATPHLPEKEDNNTVKAYLSISSHITDKEKLKPEWCPYNRYEEKQLSYYPRWIPVTERLPEPETELLLTVKRWEQLGPKPEDGKYYHYVVYGCYEVNEDYMIENEDDENLTYINAPKRFWHYATAWEYGENIDYDYDITDEVVAWMPIPEPYGGWDVDTEMTTANELYECRTRNKNNTTEEIGDE